MNILEFIQKFPDEGTCRLKFKGQRDQIGIIFSNLVRALLARK